MEKFIRMPSVDFLPGIRVTKETRFGYENENVKQSVTDLVFHSVTKVEGDGYTSTYDTTIQLAEGDVLIFEDEGRGYIKPAYEKFGTVAEAIAELENIKELR